MQVRSNSISQWKTGKSLFSTGDHLHFRTILFTFILLKDRASMYGKKSRTSGKHLVVVAL